MSGKGSKRRPCNEAKVREHWPFPERKLASQWCADLDLFPMGEMPEGRLTEVEFRDALAKAGHMHKTSEPITPNHS